MKFFSYICNRVALDTGMCAANSYFEVLGEKATHKKTN